MLVSIVLPTYNRGPLLVEAVSRARERHIDSIDWIDAKRRAETKFTLARRAYAKGDIEGLRRHLPFVLRHRPFLVLDSFKSGILAMVLGQRYLKRKIEGMSDASRFAWDAAFRGEDR